MVCFLFCQYNARAILFTSTSIEKIRFWLYTGYNEKIQLLIIVVLNSEKRL